MVWRDTYSSAEFWSDIEAWKSVIRGDKTVQTIDRDMHVPIKTWAPWGEVEETAKAQILNVSNLSVVWPWVAIMPDVHAGMGACIGSVIPTRSALIPSATGVDIGCGMVAIRTNILTDDFVGLSFSELREEIEDAIPHGVGKGYPRNAPEFSVGYEAWFLDAFAEINATLPDDYLDTAIAQCGTLGSGNHFIELSEDEYGKVWIVVHSGSRGLGNKIAMHHIRRAKEACGGLDLPDPALAFFSDGSAPFDAYWDDLRFAQRYAMLNRYVMATRIGDVLGRHFSYGIEDQVHCHHNYAAKERHLGQELFVTRKGAIRAGVGDRGVIPGSMNSETHIVTGLGNKEAFFTAPHGAGRVMSRKKAKKTFTVEDVVAQTAGVECRKDAGVLDELPASYKDISDVMEHAKTLVRIDHTLKQFLCVKG